MTPQEKDLIDGLVQRIRSTQVNDKDTEAEQYLHQGLAGYPDAIYVLAQTVLVQQYGLQQAQQQLQQLQAEMNVLKQQQAQSGSSGGSFLSHLFGGGSPTPQGSQFAQPSQAYEQQTPYQPVNNPGYPAQGYGQPGYPPPAYVQPYPPAYAQPVGYGPMGGGGGFLRGALQTAAGVAAGEFLVDELFHGFGGHDSYVGGPREEVVNNYYGDHDQYEHREASQDDGNFYNPEHDASRQGFADTGSDTQQFADDGNNAQDDSSSYDDASSGSDDSGSDFGGGDDSSF